jgi:phosphatidylserine decarboxylase
MYGWTFWAPLALAGGLATVVLALLPGLWWAALVAGILTVAGLAFFRDFPRTIPQQPGIMVAPADGKLSEITHLDHYAPFGGPALKVGIFLSVLDVHINRSPCEGVILWTRYEEGLFLDARHPDCSAKNQSHTICLGAKNTPQSDRPTAVVKQIVGAIARRIIAPIEKGDTLARGQRFGMIAFGSRTELYVPAAEGWEVAVPMGTHVKGGVTVLLRQRG